MTWKRCQLPGEPSLENRILHSRILVGQSPKRQRRMSTSAERKAAGQTIHRVLAQHRGSTERHKIPARVLARHTRLCNYLTLASAARTSRATAVMAPGFGALTGGCPIADRDEHVRRPDHEVRIDRRTHAGRLDEHRLVTDPGDGADGVPPE
jgi:hypothetical protein